MCLDSRFSIFKFHFLFLLCWITVVTNSNSYEAFPRFWYLNKIKLIFLKIKIKKIGMSLS